MISSHNRQGIKTVSDSNVIVNNIELTPLIDIIFIIIVFLLLTANVRLLSLPITVPETDDISAAVSMPGSSININISVDDMGWFIEKAYFADWTFFRAELLKKIAGEPDAIVLIAADQQADVQRFVKVLTLLQTQGVMNTKIILNKET